MKTSASFSFDQPADEIAALLLQLQETHSRLQELTGGDVDAVVLPGGQSYLLHEAQEKLRLSEAALLTSEHSMAAAQRVAHFGSWELELSESKSIDESRLTWSAEMFRIAGYEPNSVEVNKGLFFNLVPSEEHEPIRQAIAAAVRKRGQYFIVHRLIQPSGLERVVQETGEIIVDDFTGEPLKIVGACHDITERTRAELVAREIEQRTRLFSDLGDATRTLDSPDQIMSVMTRMLGQHLQASRSAFANVEADGERLAILMDYTDSCASIVGNYQLADFGERVASTLRAGETLVIRDADAELLPQEKENFNAVAVKAVISCPLVEASCLRAIMSIHQTTARNWTLNEIAIAQEVAERCWAAMNRVAAIKALRQSEALLRIASRTARLGGWSVDLPEGYLNWSDEVCAIHDVPPGTEPNFDQAMNFYTPESQSIIAKAFADCAEQGIPYDIKLEVITAKARPIWVRAIGEAQYSAAGSVNRVHGAFQDITEQEMAKQAEEELSRKTERRERMLTTMLASIDDFAYIYDLEGRFLFANQPLLDLWGLTFEEIEGRKVHELAYPAELAAQLEQQIKRVVETREAVTDETPFTSAAGLSRYYEYIFSPAIGADGSVEFIAGSTRDVTERKRAEQALRVSEERYRKIITHIGAVPYQFDYRTKQYVFIGAEILDLTGYASEEFTMELWDTLTQEIIITGDGASPNFWDAAEQTREGDLNEWKAEMRICTRSGAIRWLSDSSLQILGIDGKSVGSLGILEDITDRKKAEAALLALNADLEDRVSKRTAELASANVDLKSARDEANRANNAKSVFLSRMSHELRTPLNATLGFAQMLQNTNLDERQTECVQHVLTAGEHLLGLINEVLELAHVESGHITNDVEEVNLYRLIEESLALVQSHAQRRGIQLKYEANDTENLIYVDPQRLKQVLLNLLSNAVKYNIDNGSVVIRWTPTPLGRLKFFVVDTGPGIAPDKIARLFVPFERLDAVKRGIEGTGLGLVVTRSIVEALGGSMGIESEPGQGSTFWFEIPSIKPGNGD